MDRFVITLRDGTMLSVGGEKMLISAVCNYAHDIISVRRITNGTANN